MASTPTSVQFANRKNQAFKTVVSGAMLFTANQKLQLGQVAPNTAGYQAYVKRTTLASNVIKNPDAYTEMFAAELLMVNGGTTSDETDPNNLTGPVDTVWDNVAGVNQNDINL
jgi:hypothetical protein